MRKFFSTEPRLLSLTTFIGLLFLLLLGAFVAEKEPVERAERSSPEVLEAAGTLSSSSSSSSSAETTLSGDPPETTPQPGKTGELPEAAFGPRFGMAGPSDLERLVTRAEELDRRDKGIDDDGFFHRERLLFAEGLKYPYLRVEESFRPLPDGGWDPHPDIIVSSARHLLVRFDQDLEDDFIERMVEQEGGRVLAFSLQPGLVLAELPEATLDAVPMAAITYAEAPGVRFAEPDYMVETFGGLSVNDPLFDDLYGLVKIEAPQAWDITTGSSSTLIGVIDSGVDYTHEDLVANIFYNEAEIENGEDTSGNGFIDDIRGWNFKENNNDPMDDNRHGTHVAGTIAAAANNEKGVVGVTWNARILPIRFLGNEGGFSSDGINGIYYATMMGAKITNNSWGGGGFSTAMRDAIDDAGAAGSLFVAAAGNNGNDQLMYPAAFNRPNMISVAASTASDQRASFSTYGSTVHVAAPGHQIMSAVLNNGYEKLSGTSMASPHVAGAAALVHAVAPELPVTMLREWLLNSVDELPVWDGFVTSGGRLNVRRAIEENLDIPVVLLEGFSFTDSGGPWADNGVANPGETIALTVKLRNAGPYAANGLNATLTTSNPGVAIVEGSRSFGDLPAWTGVSEGDGSFVVNLDPEMSTPQEINFQLMIEDDEDNTFVQTLILPVYTSTEISGLVTTVEGTPLAGAKVSYLGPWFGEAMTDTNGEFSIVVIDGSYRINVSKAEFSPIPPRVVAVPPAQTDLHFVLGRAEGVASRNELDIRTGKGNRIQIPVTLTNTGNIPLTYEVLPVTYDSNYYPEGIGDGENQFPWHDITVTGRKLTRDDNLSGYNPNDPLGNTATFTPSGPYPLGIRFPFYEENFAQVIINNSGFLTFTDFYRHNSTPVELPDLYNATRNKIAFAWQLPNWWLQPQPGAPEGTETAYMETLDPYTFVFTWVRWPVKPLGWTETNQDDEYLSGQVELRSDGRILLKYNEYRTKSGGSNFVKGGPVDYIAGIQDGSRTRGLTAINRDNLEARPTAGSVVEIYPRYNAPWLSVDRRAGTLLPSSEEVEFMLTLDTEGLGPGTYTTEFALRTNDPDHPVFTVPVTFTVEENETSLVLLSPTDESRVAVGESVLLQGAVEGDATTLSDLMFVINETDMLPASPDGAGVYRATLADLPLGEYHVQFQGNRLDSGGTVRSQPRRILVGEGYRLHLHGQEFGTRPTVLSDNKVSLERFDVPALDFARRSFQVYGNHHDGNITQGWDPHLAIHEVGPDRRTVHFTGRNYQRLPLTYTVTPDTVLEFEFRSLGGEIHDLHAIGLESGLAVENTFKPERLFQISGAFEDPDLRTVPKLYPKAYGINGTPPWQRFRIRIGEHYTGPVQHLVYVQDRYNESATLPRLHMMLHSSLRNVRVYEEPEEDFSFVWSFSDTDEEFTGETLKRTYSSPGDYELSVEAFRAGHALGQASRSFTVVGEPRISYKINFQPDSLEAPGGFLADTGELFGDRGNGLTYGWDQALPSQTSYTAYEGFVRIWNTQRVSSIRAANNRTWEMEVPNGRYSVTLVVGHMTQDSQNRFDVQGQQVINRHLNPLETTDANITVDVTNGRLQIRSRQNTGSLAYVLIEQVVSASGQRPTANFTYNPTEGADPLEVTFNASPSHVTGSTLVDYAWDFGPFGSASGIEVTRTFPEPGNHPVRLTVTSADGRQGEWIGVVRVLGPTPPEILWQRPPPPYALRDEDDRLSFQIRLATEPANPVALSWVNDHPDRLAITPADGLTFGTENWDQWQSVELSPQTLSGGLPTVVATWETLVSSEDSDYAAQPGDSLSVVIHSTEENAPPQIQLVEPSSPWITLGEGVDLKVRTQVTDDGFPFPEPQLAWHVLHGPAGVKFSPADAAETVIGFPGQGQYQLRLTAFDGADVDSLTLHVQVVENGLDELPEGLVTAVRWGSEANMGRLGSIGHRTEKRSHGGDNRFPGMGNHNSIRTPLQPLKAPLLNAEGENLPSRSFYFGMESVRQSSVSFPAPFGMRVGPTPEYSPTMDWRNTGVQWQTMIHLWEKEQFLDDWSEQVLRADHPGAYLEVTVRENLNGGPVRMLVKQGDTWYASQTSFLGQGRFILENPEQTLWTPVHVAYTQNKAGSILEPPGPFDSLILDDIQGVGFVVVSDQLGTSVVEDVAAHRFGFDNFRAVLAGDYPHNQGPVMAWDGPESAEKGGTLELTLRARDDGRPLSPGETQLAWSLLEGPAPVTFPQTEAVMNGAFEQTFTLSLPEEAGVYVFEATADDGDIQTRSLYTLYVSAEEFLEGPEILTHPQSVTAEPGQDVFFEVSATGSEPLRYQWYKDGLPLPGETAPVLEIWNVLLLEQGDYTVEVSNPVGSITSEVAVLDGAFSHPLPSVEILSPSDGSQFLAGVSVFFQVEATDTNQSNLAPSATWQSSQDGALGTGTTLQLNNLAEGEHLITVTVTDSFGGIATDQISLNILPNQPGSVTYHPGTSLYAETTPRFLELADMNDNVGVRSTQQILQTFQVAETLDVEAVKIVLNNLNDGRNFDLQLHDLGIALSGDSIAHSLVSGTVIATTGTLTVPAGTKAITNPGGGGQPSTLRWQLGLPVQLQAGRTYALSAQGDDADLSTLVWRYVRPNNDTPDFNPTGAAYGRINGDWGKTVLFQSGRNNDLSLALVPAAEIPPPVVEITSPANGSNYLAGETVSFAGSATDSGDGDLSADATWTSSRDGLLGSGGELNIATLSVGPHTITFSATNSAGLTVTDSVSLTVNEEAGPEQVLVRYTFTEAPEVGTQHSSGTFTRQAAPTEVYAGITASDFHLRNHADHNARLIATDSANGIAGAAQIAGIQSALFQWESEGSSNPYYEFTLEGAETLEALKIVARSGAQWNNTGEFLSYEANRRAEISVRSSLDNYAATIGAVFVAGNNGNFTEQTLDLSALNVDDEAVTFRIYTRAYGSSDGWHRTQVDQVEVTGTFLEEPDDLYDLWVAENNIVGGPEDRTNGVPNLLRYALGGTGDSPAAEFRLNTHRTASGITLDFPRIDDPRITYEIWSSTDLLDWGESPVWSEQGAGEGEVPIEIETNRQFWKLRVWRE